MSDSNTLIDLEIPANSYMIACTNIKNFEEGENCASTISMEQTIGSDMILFGSDMILLVSIFQVHELSVLLVAGFINFTMTNQVPQVSFKSVVGDLISLHSFESNMNLFLSDLFCYMIICGSGFNIQYITVFIVIGFTNFGVTN